jgi:adhesin HecA-like repeat protein
LRFEMINGRRCLRLTGAVSLDNNGGFIQAALDLAPDGGVLDASTFAALELDVCGPPETYGVHLRTTDLTRPWQSFRAGFVTTPGWQTVRLPLSGFAPHRTEVRLDPARLWRLGLIAIGRVFCADLAVAGVRLVP